MLMIHRPETWARSILKKTALLSRAHVLHDLNSSSVAGFAGARNRPIRRGSYLAEDHASRPRVAFERNHYLDCVEHELIGRVKSGTP